jgi:hypothetical protein
MLCVRTPFGEAWEVPVSDPPVAETERDTGEASDSTLPDDPAASQPTSPTVRSEPRTIATRQESRDAG